ncbi:SDR family NAD(P)-dependent oxidoreductase [Paraburkholderia sp. BCC1886]|uniref:SDR family NAD(P)-dependent oxidoreductase n=1 Tax=Paraburkholderia sp. BCC1886 TaxID=2562670 RepID=UPI0011846A1A|nr:SDR family oxidoreductase [Paraburkholderia sp. BCC1886]
MSEHFEVTRDGANRTAVRAGAIVTGAASGIGRAVAQALHEAGWNVVGIDLHSSEGSQAVPVLHADISEEAQVERVIAQAAAQLGELNLVVNCAGIEIDASVEEMEVRDIDRMFAVNVRGTMLVTRAALRHIRDSGPDSGRIINVSSELAYLGRAGASAYCATKGAILSFTRSCARELAPKILVNAVAPGPIDTPLIRFAQMSAEQQAQEQDNPLRRIGQPSEVAAVVVFLASRGASFITGQCYGVDGGAAMR